MRTLIFIWLLALSSQVLAAGDLDSDFSNQNTVGNTRHNLTQRQQTNGPTGATMDPYRNDYGEVCVYCHTPHGSNTTTAAPLWNRTMLASTTYTTYSSMTIEGTVGTPGTNSLTCLSCHDGKVAVDSIINMPGSGKYLKAQETAQSNSFLNTQWTNASGTDASAHLGMSDGGCLACHTPANPDNPIEAIIKAGAVDFTLFALGTDLSNDHPIGVPYRDPDVTPGADYNSGATTQGSLMFFDRDGDSRADKNEVRFYNTGGGFEVECASCHDPHGVPSGGAGSPFIKTFLRVTNTGSALCLTCHAK